MPGILPGAALDLRDRAPLSAGAVVSLGTEHKKLTATGATKAVANDICPRTFWKDR
jgi:hypothetical protein